ncbi:hypothetical protein C5167_041629 [Papaver somniferum]|uniref:uncharacterized protein LOC113327654 n=1 Tax=Papaver somniferum TaxID=3469 RepID=UPI000E6FA37F|nr:uncharacterized protein LOC113327654 [Papaver somniferum]RZC85446.1 hypothetical protein C5167_041629 [Papaver somniferum]
MSWYGNPNCFLRCKGPKHRFHIYKIQKKFSVPLNSGDFDTSAVLDFSRHLSLGHNQESDYDVLKSWLNADGCVNKYVNCQGLVIYRNYGDSPSTWSRVEENDSTFYNLPGITNPYEIKLAKKRADEKKISDLQDKLDYEVTKLNSEVTYLQEKLNQEKNDRQAQVSDLPTKLEECRLCSSARGGSADVQPWTSGDTVSSHLVPSKNLDVISYPNSTSVTIMEGSSSWSRVEEDDSIFYSLPGIANHSETMLAEKQAVEKNMSELVAQNSVLREKLKEQLNREKKFSELVAEISGLKGKLNNEVTNLQEQLNQEKNDRKALQTQVLDLTAKLEECRGVGGGID